MIELKRDMFEIMKEEIHLCRIFCVTTNGFLKSNGNAVMGKGIAKQFKGKLPNHVNETILGNRIQKYGNKVNYLSHIGKTLFFSLPVKKDSGICNGKNTVSHSSYKIGDFVPGFHLRADIELIESSAKELVIKANYIKANKIYLPQPGCGNGELSWDNVKPILDKYFDNRFIILSI